MVKKKKEKAQSVRIKPLLAILCDDIREEKNGKDMIIGIYHSGITVGALPDKNDPEQKTPVLYLSLWISCEIENEGEAIVEFRVVTPSEEAIAIKAKAIKKPTPHPEILTFKFSGFPVVIKEEGLLKVLFKHEGDEKWETLRTFPVKFNPDLVSNALPPPSSL